jgi:acetyl-CoA acyltransferase
MKAKYGTDSMPETAENVAADFGIARADQDAFALRSQQRCAAAQHARFFEARSLPVTMPQRRATGSSVEGRASARDLARGAGQAQGRAPDGTVTAGNASGTNDGAAAMLIAS